MYVRYVSDDHRPTRMMVLSDAPLSFIAMAPPALRLCDKIWFRVYPFVRRQSQVAPHCTVMPMSRSETWERRPDSLYTEFSWQFADFACWMLAMRRAMAATGQTGPPIALWCTTAPFVPFLVCAMHMVALSACISARSPAECGIISPRYHNLISQSHSGIVLFVLAHCGVV
jgi:hypothetical protein